MCCSQSASICELEELDLITAISIPIFDRNLIGDRRIGSIVDIDDQVIFQAMHEQIVHPNICAEDDLIVTTGINIAIADTVLAISAIEVISIAADTALDPIITATATDHVDILVAAITASGFDDIIPIATFDAVVGTVAKGNRVTTGTTTQYIDTISLVDDHIITSATIDDVIAAAIRDPVIAGTAINHIVAIAIADRVIT